MIYGRQNRFPTILSTIADADQTATREARAEVVTAPPSVPRLREAQQVETPAYAPPRRARGARWVRPRRSLDRHIPRLTAAPAEPMGRIPMPRIPEGIPEEEGTSLGALAGLLVAYHRTVPASLRDEYVRQVMKFAGEKAGQLIRQHWEQS